MTKHLEVERRWLIKPLSEEAKQILEKEPDAPASIVQTYLNSVDGGVKRVRFVEVDMWGVPFTHFLRTEKKLVEMGINEEVEHSLTEAEYQTEILLNGNPDHIPIKKTRYHLHHAGRLLELDVFKGDWEGLIILEAELESLSDEVELPPYLTVDREITKEKGWSNFDLSLRYSKPQGVWFGQKLVEPKTKWYERMMGWILPKTRGWDERV